MMVTTAVLAGICIPLVVYLCIAAIIVLVLGCAIYVYSIKLRQFVNRVYRKYKLRYCHEETFNFLGLPPEIRLMVYRYTLPDDGIFYMTARKHRFYGHPSHEELKNETIPPMLSLSRVCELVHSELRPLIYDQCIFYITIYSIRDLLYAMDLLDRYEVPPEAIPENDIFFHAYNIRIRVHNLILNLYPSGNGRHIRIRSELSETTPLWFGPGLTALMNDRAQVAERARMYGRREIWPEDIDAVEMKHLLRTVMLRDHVLEKSTLERMLPWYQRDQR